MSQYPIGVFDSGIGGFTVLSQLKTILPQENFIYFGDLAHLPYGSKSADNIVYYSKSITEFLLSKGAKVIVLACNSASSVAISTLRDTYKSICIIDMVNPVIEYIQDKKYKNIGVIGTEVTIQSNIYQNKLRNINDNIGCKSKATPLLVPMIEEKLHLKSISKVILENYLTEDFYKDQEALILACTHYPLIVNHIKRCLPKNIEVVDPAVIVANAVKKILVDKQLANHYKEKLNNTDAFYVSELTDNFIKNTKMFFGKKVHLVQKNLWV